MVNLDPNYKYFTMRGVCHTFAISHDVVRKWEDYGILPCTKKTNHKYSNRYFSLNEMKFIEWICYLKVKYNLNLASIAIISKLMQASEIDPDNLKHHTDRLIKDMEREGRLRKSSGRINLKGQIVDDEYVVPPEALAALNEKYGSGGDIPDEEEWDDCDE
jgi:DNA-binding transcriptional MerR regulator